jgi:flagellar hook-basal body complex protein FliE
MVSIGSSLIGGIGGVGGPFAQKTFAADAGSENNFKAVLNEALNRFERIGDETARSALDLLTGSTDDLAETMITAQKSEIALNLTVAIRNKALEAYKEIMNMQV